jgi:hypothetical protein
LYLSADARSCQDEGLDPIPVESVGFRPEAVPQVGGQCLAGLQPAKNIQHSSLKGIVSFDWRGMLMVLWDRFHVAIYNFAPITTEESAVKQDLKKKLELRS